MPCAAEKCSAPKTASGAAKHKLLSETNLSRPLARKNSPRAHMIPITSSTSPATHVDNAVRENSRSRKGTRMVKCMSGRPAHWAWKRVARFLAWKGKWNCAISTWRDSYIATFFQRTLLAERRLLENQKGGCPSIINYLAGTTDICMYISVQGMFPWEHCGKLRQVLSFERLTLALLLFHLGPGVFQRNRAVEYRRSGFRIRIDAEIAETFELIAAASRRIRQRRFQLGVRDHFQ